MSDIGLIIAWPNHLDKAATVNEEISEKFRILECYDIEWDKNNLYRNFYRFYGERLATSSIKEKATEGNVFRLVIFEDGEPQYGFRATARGIERVNTRLFDFKKALRKKLQTRFGIHASNDETETSRDLSLLLGINLGEFKAREIPEWDGDTIHRQRDVSGMNGWKNFEEFFHVMNSVEPYLVLRNADCIPDLPEDEDIDFLVRDPVKFAFFTDAKKLSRGTERANYEIVVSGKKINVDFRYVGDGYFDAAWQDDCMRKRRMNEKGIYVMDDENAYFTLAYHSFIHKKEFPDKYLTYFNTDAETLKDRLYAFMHQNGYKMVEPRDVTLHFNREYGGDMRFSRDRRIRLKKGLVGRIKRLFYKLNHAVHFRRGPA
ncbi:MAG: hypothetical protein WD342_20770 [Verrucomicrobiales bacterium]